MGRSSKSHKFRPFDAHQSLNIVLETAEHVISTGTISSSIFDARYSDVYNMCADRRMPRRDTLYKQTQKLLENHVVKLYQSVLFCGDEDFLRTYHQHWQNFSKGSSLLNRLYGGFKATSPTQPQLKDLDYRFGGFGSEIPEKMLEIEELALDTWKRQMIGRLKGSLIKLLLKEIRSDRMGGNVNDSIIHGVIMSLLDVEKYSEEMFKLELYKELFENEFIKDTEDYYRQEALQLLDGNNCSQYMAKVTSRLDEEKLRIRKILHPSSYEKAVQVCQLRMVADHFQFLHGECHDMVIKEHHQDLKHMYQLLEPIPNGLGVLIQEVEEHIKQKGIEAVKQLNSRDSNAATQFVESVLAIHGNYTTLLKRVFNADHKLIRALDKACSAVINMRTDAEAGCQSAEWLAKFCDTLLRKSIKGMSKTEIDEKLDQTITIFRYLEDKDIYQKLYSRNLTLRLIHDLSQSMDAEEAMINKLRQTCGHEYTNKLHRMFTEKRISPDINNKFRNYLKKEKTELGIIFDMQVLQAEVWPLKQTTLQFAVPLELQESIRMFEMFYKSEHSNRKLICLHSQSTVELTFSHLEKTYVVVMGALQMVVLLPFNNQDRMTLKELQTATQLPEKDLVKEIQFLLDANIITANTAGTLHETTILQPNWKYSNQRKKFKLTATMQLETPQKVEKTHQYVDEERKSFLQAAIVRIMKSQKVLQHNKLVMEVISQSRDRFVPSIVMIKKCIDTLINMEYLEHTSNKEEYRYLA